MTPTEAAKKVAAEYIAEGEPMIKIMRVTGLSASEIQIMANKINNKLFNDNTSKPTRG